MTKLLKYCPETNLNPFILLKSKLLHNPNRHKTQTPELELDMLHKLNEQIEYIKRTH